MKKGGFWWFAVAALFAVSGLYSLVSGTEGGFVTLIVAAVLAFVGYRKRKPKAPKSSSAPNTASGACPPAIVCKVAGVTFKNENGSSRQAILRPLASDPDNDYFPVTLERYTFKGNPAFYVLYNSKCVGNVPADKVKDVSRWFSRFSSAEISPGFFTNDEGRELCFADLYINFK